MIIIVDDQVFEFGVLVCLFDLDCIGFGGEMLCFYGYLQQGLIYWQGNVY